MRIICSQPSKQDSSRLGVSAYELIGFRHHPADSDPKIVCTMANGFQFKLTCGGRDPDSVLERIAEALLSPGGVADCRRIPGLRIEFLRPPAQPVYLDNKWAQTCTTQYYNDRPCLVVSAITS